MDEHTMKYSNGGILISGLLWILALGVFLVGSIMTAALDLLIKISALYDPMHLGVRRDIWQFFEATSYSK